MKVRLIGALLAVLLLASCATVPPSRQDEKVYEVIDLFNTLPAEEFAVYAGVPFLFGENVLSTESDVIAVVERVKESGLVIAPEIVGEADALSAPAGARFAVEVFYDRLPEDARLVIVESTAGELTLFLGGEAERLPQLMGIVRGRP